MAFVGKSGGGKSTLVSLIPRFYDVTEGAVLIGGVNVKNMTEEELMDQVSFVFQDNRLLKKTLRENIKMGLEADDPAVLEAAKRRSAWKYWRNFRRDWIQRLEAAAFTCPAEKLSE